MIENTLISEPLGRQNWEPTTRLGKVFSVTQAMSSLMRHGHKRHPKPHRFTKRDNGTGRSSPSHIYRHLEFIMADAKTVRGNPLQPVCRCYDRPDPQRIGLDTIVCLRTGVDAALFEYSEIVEHPRDAK